MTSATLRSTAYIVIHETEYPPCGVPVSLSQHLLHLIASHHGELAFGSPVFPKTPEAVALHYIDNLDAKLEMFRGAYETGEALAPRVLQRKAPLPANVVLPLPSVLPLEPDGEDALP